MASEGVASPRLAPSYEFSFPHLDARGAQLYVGINYMSSEIPSLVFNSEWWHNDETWLFDIGIASCPLGKSETS